MKFTPTTEDERFGHKFLIRYAHKNFRLGLACLARLDMAPSFESSLTQSSLCAIIRSFHCVKLRRMRDSNSRRVLPLGGLVNRWFQPLTQSSLFIILLISIKESNSHSGVLQGLSIFVVI